MSEKRVSRGPARHRIPVEALDRPIAYHRIFRQITGSTVAAVFLSQLWYWTTRLPVERGGWLYKTQPEMESETGLSRYEQETARKACKQRGILEEKRAGQPARMYYRIDVERLAQLIEEALYGSDPDGDAGPQQTSLGDSNKLECGITTDLLDGSPQTITESTQRPQQRPQQDSDADASEARPKAPVKKRANDEAIKLIDAYTETSGHPFPSSSGAAINVAKNLVKNGITPEDIAGCTRWMLDDPFWQSKGFDWSNVVKNLDKWRGQQARRAQQPAKPQRPQLPRGVDVAAYTALPKKFGPIG